MPILEKSCSKCGRMLPTRMFRKAKRYRHGLYSRCKKCHDADNDAQRDDPRYRLWLSSNLNSKRKGIEHTISRADIPLPKVCKYLGITIDYRRASERGRLRSPDAPSIDRIDSTRGYTPDNIQVISDLANRMKSEATVDQLLAFAEGVIRVHGSQDG